MTVVRAMGDRGEEERPSADTRDRWLQACEAARAKVYRGLIAMGASRSDAEDSLQDALETAVRARVPASKPEGWLFVVAVRG